MSQAPQRVIFTAPGTAELQRYTAPVPGPHQLLIRTQISLISPGTERAFFLGLPNTSDVYPQPAGYNNVGIIIGRGSAIPEDAPGLQIGDRVASAGHHAAIITADAADCIPVPATLQAEDAVFFFMLSIALQGIRRAQIEIGEPVAILGAGLIGLLAAQFARLNGAAPVISIDPQTKRHPFAQQIGADATLAELGDTLPQQLAAWSRPEGPPVVIEATGHPEAVVTAMQIVAPGGRVVLLGSTRGETEQVNFYRDVHRKGITVIGAHNIARPQFESRPGCWTQSDDSRTVLRLLELGRLRVAALVTHRYPWTQALEAYALLKAWDPDALGILLDWTH